MVYVDSGVSLGKLLRFCLKHSLGGLEFSVGIPGSVGGALVGNAGSQGGAVGNLVRYVDVLLPDASVERILGSDIHWGYRFSSLSQKPWVILGCALELRREPPDVLEKKMAFFGEKRKGQPVFRKTAGSVFKNPPGGYAGKLLELSGCKGRKIGGARVSLEHANFIENHNGASSQDILDLIFLCRKMVREHTGIVLYPEVRFVGFESSKIVFN
jgi:UDP-N-acetylmuramate dehydrogenase